MNIRTQYRYENMAEHITHLITKMALLNTEINIKVNNLIKIHFNELDELILK